MRTHEYEYRLNKRRPFNPGYHIPNFRTEISKINVKVGNDPQDPIHHTMTHTTGNCLYKQMY